MEKNVYIPLETEEQRMPLLELFEKEGFRWLSGHKPTKWKRRPRAGGYFHVSAEGFISCGDHGGRFSEGDNVLKFADLFPSAVKAVDPVMERLRMEGKI